MKTLVKTIIIIVVPLIAAVYPPSVQYLEDHYGIQIDHDRFAVFYEIFGDNVMPQITVMEVSDEPEG